MSFLQELVKGEPVKETEYYAHIGRFIVAHAAAEGQIHTLARRLTGMKDAKARLIFAKRSVGDVIVRIRALVLTSRFGEKQRKNIEECLTQFGLIAEQRDKLVHRYVNIREGKVHVSNFATAKDLISAEQTLFTALDLIHLHLDCLNIYLRLFDVIRPAYKRTSSRSAVEGRYRPWYFALPKSKKLAKEKQREQSLIAEALLTEH